MAARKRNWIDPKTREKIRTTKIIQRMEQFALGEDEPNKSTDKDGNRIKVTMTSAQVKAAEVLISKTMPALTAADINMTQEDGRTKEEKFDALVEAVGYESAIKIAPDFIPKGRTLN